MRLGNGIVCAYYDPAATVYNEVSTNKKMKGDAMEMNTNTAYGSHVSQNHKY